MFIYVQKQYQDSHTSYVQVLNSTLIESISFLKVDEELQAKVKTCSHGWSDFYGQEALDLLNELKRIDHKLCGLPRKVHDLPSE